MQNKQRILSPNDPEKNLKYKFEKIIQVYHFAENGYEKSYAKFKQYMTESRARK